MDGRLMADLPGSDSPRSGWVHLQYSTVWGMGGSVRTCLRVMRSVGFEAVQEDIGRVASVAMYACEISDLGRAWNSL